MALKLRDYEGSYEQYTDRIETLLSTPRPVAVRASVNPFGVYSLPASIVMDIRNNWGDDAAYQALYTFLLVNDYSKPAEFFSTRLQRPSSSSGDTHFGVAYYEH